MLALLLFFAFTYLFSALCYGKTALFSANQNRVIFSCILLVLKIEQLSHIMGPTPILEMTRAYSLRPRLWLLVSLNFPHICKLFFLSNVINYYEEQKLAKLFKICPLFKTPLRNLGSSFSHYWQFFSNFLAF